MMSPLLGGVPPPRHIAGRTPEHRRNGHRLPVVTSMTETFAPKLLKPTLSPRVATDDRPEVETGLEPSLRQATIDKLPAAPTERLVSLDAYRGLVMVLMVS